METQTETSSLVTSSERMTGRVKWFNNQYGYGFITVTDGEQSGTDIFVHHSGVQVSSQQYKYLVQGEYVQFKLVTSSEGKHEFQASDVSGINGGKLMCETRRDFKQARTNYKDSQEGDEQQQVEEAQVRAPRSTRPPVVTPALERTQSVSRGAPRTQRGPRQDAGDEADGWKLAGKDTKKKSVPRKPRAPKEGV
jgi:cold shock CspA family protein